MADTVELDEWLVLTTVCALLVQSWAVLGLYRLSCTLRGRPGHQLAVITLGFAVLITIGQVGAVANAYMLHSDPNGTYETRLVVFAVTQLITVSAVLIAFWRVGRMERDRHGRS